MLSSVLRSDRAALVNIAIMRTCVRLRQILASHKELAKQLEEIGKKYDKQFKVVFEISGNSWSLHRTRRRIPLDSWSGKNNRSCCFLETRSHRPATRLDHAVSQDVR